MSTTLCDWSKKKFGDIFHNVKMYEEQIHNAEEKCILDSMDSNWTNLHELNAQYIKFLKLEDSIFKQKDQLQWFKEGDTNYIYFHWIIRGKERNSLSTKLQLKVGTG